MAISSDEYKSISHIIMNAKEELEEKGTTEIRCPICNSTLHLQKIGASRILSCSTDDCLVVPFRGI